MGSDPHGRRRAPPRGGVPLPALRRRAEARRGAALELQQDLTAVIKGLSALKEPCRVHIVTDSKYVSDGISKGWAKSWQENGWKKADKKPALNTELWQKLLDLLSVHTVDIEWVKGHSGHKENERCDALAVSYYKKLLENKK